jgi:hypothetical protein
LNQQRQKIAQHTLIVEARPKFSALQNVQALFADKPVVTHEKHRIRMEEIASMNFDEEEKQDPGYLFKQLMTSINPFAQYVIEECKQEAKKEWVLEESLFQKPQQAHDPEKLQKNSSEMFVIYKYVNDPLLKVKSEKYCGNGEDFVQIKDLFPIKNLLQTSPLNVQLNHLMLPP